MIPNLPRPLLWTEKTSLEEFVEDDYINMAFYNIFLMHPTGFHSSQRGSLKVVRNILYQWKQAGLIVKRNDQEYQKAKKGKGS